ncbi:hypothetical protein H6F77_11800 [Microcoleus sp. FACHB-831]|nr:hypothetical protein [Microcoleus sp. FACHB-831]MBD1921773.1 hypothetical protein [Microcoleus sp. FACHB-831]
MDLTSDIKSGLTEHSPLLLGAIALGEQKLGYRRRKGWLHQNIPHLYSN